MIRHSAYKVDWTELDRKELGKLLKHEKDPGIDQKQLEKLLDEKKLREKDFKKIYTSPLKRARQTAQKISEVLDIPVEEREELAEHKFKEVPREVFSEGSEAVRQYLLDKNQQKTIETGFMLRKADKKVIMVSHGFKMRSFYLKLFSGHFQHLRDNEIFRRYLTGFGLQKGQKMTLKSCDNEREL
ncbi:MAG: fructose-2,6-bisphosphatase [Candidatus Nanosalina sp. J07AB43]|nr:MAG: fructose-2,6-bisphosphatase [Candidatus Nanosalina sp. J07AB43]